MEMMTGLYAICDVYKEKLIQFAELKSRVNSVKSLEESSSSPYAVPSTTSNRNSTKSEKKRGTNEKKFASMWQLKMMDKEVREDFLFFF